ncbi:MAG TPA: histidine kinase, partial [Euzebya sp.]|nr:histidine kinase [Euzebya sp.]
ACSSAVTSSWVRSSVAEQQQVDEDRDHRPDVATSLGGLVKLAVDLRLLLLLVAMVVALVQGADRRVLALMLMASYAGVGLLLWWDRVAAALLRRPALFILDVAVTVGILVTTGVEGPFVLYTVSTAFLAGVLYGVTGGAVFGTGLALAYALVTLDMPKTTQSFMTLIGIPVLITVAGLGAAALRSLLLQTADMEAELAQAVSTAAAAEERSRLAREMHDTLGKTLHGISLSAAALPQWLEKRPDQVAAKAAQVAAAAETAALEARQLISDLRSDSMNVPLHAAVVEWARDWATMSGIELSLAVTQVGVMSASSRYELFTILREALRNVQAHSGARRVSVYLAQDGGDVVLEVADDGVGLASTDLDQLAADGHYGLVGMRERARRAGGEMSLQYRGNGTTIRAVVPMTSAHDMVIPTPEVSRT